MKIRLIESNKILAETDNTNLIKVLNLKYAEIKIKKDKAYYIYHYEHSSYNFDEDVLEVYLRQFDIEDIDCDVNIDVNLKRRRSRTSKINKVSAEERIQAIMKQRKVDKSNNSNMTDEDIKNIACELKKMWENEETKLEKLQNMISDEFWNI